MRYELSDYMWGVIKPMLPNKPRGIPRVDNRRVLNGIFWTLGSGAPWRDPPESYGPPTTCYNRFVRWRRASVWDQIMDALAAAHDAVVQMIDTSVVRRHQHGSCIAGNREQHMGRSRGGLTSKFHASTERVAWSSGSSTRSGSAGVSPSVMTSSQPITLPSSSLLRSAFGCALMSPRPGSPGSGSRPRRSLPRAGEVELDKIAGPATLRPRGDSGEELS